MDNQNKNKKRNLALKIIIPVIVVAIIAGIWFFKTNQEKQEVAAINMTDAVTDESQETISSDTLVNTEESNESSDAGSTEITTDKSVETTNSSSSESETTEVQEKINPDFLLATTKLDMEKLKSYGLPIIIDFGADSCIPCKEMAPVLKKLNAEWQGKVIVKFVDVWKYPDASADFPVQVIPTQFFFDAQGKPFVPSDPEGMQMMMYSLKDTQEHVYTAHQGGMTEGLIRTVFAEMGVK